jgi:hypothetical protein
MPPSPRARSSRPCRLPCPRRADSRPMPHRRSDRVGLKSLSPLFGKPRCRAIRRRQRASLRAPAPPPQSKASHGVKLPRCLRPPPYPCPDSNVRCSLLAPPPGLSVLVVPAALPVSAVATEGPLATVRAGVHHGRGCGVPRPAALPSRVVAMGMRAPWALGPALGPNVGSAH